MNSGPRRRTCRIVRCAHWRNRAPVLSWRTVPARSRRPRVGAGLGKPPTITRISPRFEHANGTTRIRSRHRYTAGMDDFADVAKARASYKRFVEAMKAGREIMQRVGVPDPPPIPEFDVVFRRMSPAMRKELYA